MKHDHFVVQSPDKPAQQLLLLFHGVGDNPVAMGEIGSWFAPLFPDALIVSIGGAEPYGTTSGRQWFSVQGVTEENRQRVLTRLCRCLSKPCATGRNKAAFHRRPPR